MMVMWRLCLTSVGFCGTLCKLSLLRTSISHLPWRSDDPRLRTAMPKKGSLVVAGPFADKMTANAIRGIAEKAQLFWRLQLCHGHGRDAAFPCSADKNK
jgi:hypothetical protein